MIAQTSSSRPSRLDALLSQRARQVSPEPLLQGMDDAGKRISFVFGFPDPASLPASEVAEATTHALAERGRAALQYGDNAGYAGEVTTKATLADAFAVALERTGTVIGASSRPT